MFNRLFILGLILICPCLTWTQRSFAEQPPPSVKQDMDAVYSAFRDLQKYMVSKSVFVDAKNSHAISDLLQIMNARFHQVGMITPRYSQEPGFVSTIKTMNLMLADAQQRFKEGKKDYVFWRLQASSSYCISCHTRYEVPFDFNGSNTDLSGFNRFEQGEFYLATRQFDKAKIAFMDAVNDPKLHFDRMVALYKWLVIYTRVHPNAKEAIVELKHVRRNIELPKNEKVEIDYWLESLQRWEKEGKIAEEPLVRAEKLLRQGINLNESQVGTKGMVEILRATAILHSAMNDSNPSYVSKRGDIYYQLGLAYSNLPNLFVNELPEVLLEECIRSYPNSEAAHKAYQLLQDNLALDFTGSSGTRFPPEVAAKLKQLRKIAYAEDSNKKSIVEKVVE